MNEITNKSREIIQYPFTHILAFVSILPLVMYIVLLWSGSGTAGILKGNWKGLGSPSSVFSLQKDKTHIHTHSFHSAPLEEKYTYPKTLQVGAVARMGVISTSEFCHFIFNCCPPPPPFPPCTWWELPPRVVKAVLCIQHCSPYTIILPCFTHIPLSLNIEECVCGVMCMNWVSHVEVRRRAGVTRKLCSGAEQCVEVVWTREEKGGLVGEESCKIWKMWGWEEGYDTTFEWMNEWMQNSWKWKYVKKGDIFNSEWI